MREIMYDKSSVLLAAILLLSMVLAIESGYRIGRRYGAANESSKTQINTIQASVLGILALLLGFTFSMSLQRFDSRSAAVIEEANAIGTTYLRAQLLPVSVRNEVQQLLRGYLDKRIEGGTITLAHEAEREALREKANQDLDALWRYARLAAEEDRSPVRSALFIQALNELIDSFGRREGALTRHVPELVLLLLYGAFITTGCILGHAAGVAGDRMSFPTYLMVTLVVLLVFIIIDLDRPRRGFIQVDHKSLIELKVSIDASEGSGTQP